MPKIVFPAALAPSTAGPVVAVSNDYDGWDHYPSECEVSNAYDKNS